MSFKWRNLSSPLMFYFGIIWPIKVSILNFLRSLGPVMQEPQFICGRLRVRLSWIGGMFVSVGMLEGDWEMLIDKESLPFCSSMH